MRRLLTAVLLAAVLAACSPPIAEDAPGDEIYRAYCAGCHGDRLQGGTGPALGVGSPSVDRPRQYFVDTTTNGRSRMPGFGSTLSEDQIARVVDFILDEQGR